jgi:hypothetical protein
MRTQLNSAAIILTWVGIALAQSQPMLRLPPDEAERVHASLYSGIAGAIAQKLAKTSGDVTLDPPPQPILRQPLRTEDNGWGLVDIMCSAQLVVIGRSSNGVAHQTSDGGFLYTDWTVTVDTVLKDNPKARVSPGTPLLVVWPGGKLHFGNRWLQAEEPGRNQLNPGVEHFLILRLVPQTGAYSAGTELALSANRVIIDPQGTQRWADSHWPTDLSAFLDLVRKSIAAGLNCG